MRIDQVAIRLQSRRETAWHRLGAMVREVFGPVLGPVPLRAAGALGVLCLVVAYWYYPPGLEVGTPRGANGGNAVVADRRSGESGGVDVSDGVTAANDIVQLARGEREADYGGEEERPGGLPSGPPATIAAVRSGIVTVAAWRGDVGRRWEDDVEGGWQKVSTDNSADIGGVEEGNARIGEFMDAIRGLWGDGAESDSQESMAFGRQLEEFVRARTGEGIAEYCVASQWQFARRSRGAQEEERGRLEVRRRELEDERRELDLGRREWDVSRREKEIRRRELEAARRDAEAKREATEARSGPDSEEYWQVMGAYERVLEGYASEFDNEMKTFYEQYYSFMNDTYVAGQHGYVNGIAEVIVGYSALLWGCETDGQVF